MLDDLDREQERSCETGNCMVTVLDWYHGSMNSLTLDLAADLHRQGHINTWLQYRGICSRQCGRMRSCVLVLYRCFPGWVGGWGLIAGEGGGCTQQHIVKCN
jgi:hypothetical protein